MWRAPGSLRSAWTADASAPRRRNTIAALLAAAASNCRLHCFPRLAYQFSLEPILENHRCTALGRLAGPARTQAAAGWGGDIGKVLEALVATAPYELGLGSSLYPVYLRGEAYLAAKQGTAAAVEFQKILDHPGVVANELIGALAHLQLGRAYALSGDTTKAKAAYQDFFALWKDADPDIPILKQAKAEYVKLQ